ncbi:MAG: class I SAM-dependent methyltransferase [Gammaproteobacteria bacterium]|nr:class I SAM-dependent methyltransferase [Gammaproteobacteria bacterium]
MQQRSSATIDHLLANARRLPAAVELEVDDEGVVVGLLDPALNFHHSFLSGPLARRARQPSQALIRACNNKSRNIDEVLDLTAGWGADSLTLAFHGQRVTLLEQNKLLFAILEYSLQRLATDPAGADCATRMQLEHMEAGEFLRRLDDSRGFDCIYLDPMFPLHKSSAKPAKEMQILQVLTANVAIEPCFELALQKARKRVVVKRPAKADGLTALKPDIVYREKTIRFDVYLTA